MDLLEYFQDVAGTGILSTADADGRTNLAVYARPHVFDNETIGFIMRDRKSYKNLKSNPHAAYMFIESESRYKGIRLYLSKIDEEFDPEVVNKFRRRPKKVCSDGGKETAYLVRFHVDRTRPLVGDND
ncbi:MAG: pyridoxamine 5'-phosphate oxidase family protein [Sedimentisphaerales bacterium]|nr:pyridoxamine 5'-phosphate oxidase family protein [Sedimentisphaerales bacterium]